MQVHTSVTRSADIGQRTFDGAREMQEMAESVFDALQRHGGVVVRDLTEVEKDVVEGLQQVVTTLGADQIDLLVRVVNPFTRLHVNEGNAAALIVGEVDEGPASAK